MKNVFSHQIGSVFTGKEIKEYLLHRVSRGQSIAGFQQYLSLKDDRRYIMVFLTLTEVGKRKIGFERYGMNY